MKQKLNLTAVTIKNRFEIIEKIKDTISSSDGFIINFNMFSDLSLALCIEIEENKIIDLHTALANIISISDIESASDIRDLKREWFVFLNVSFIKGKGDLEKKIPAVPG